MGTRIRQIAFEASTGQTGLGMTILAIKVGDIAAALGAADRTVIRPGPDHHGALASPAPTCRRSQSEGPGPPAPPPGPTHA